MKLFEPGRIGNLLLKNRVVMAPMGMGPIVDSYSRFSQRLIDHYTVAAKGGAGLIITGLCRVSRTIESMMAPFLPSITEHMHVERLSELADAIHDYGAKIAIQLTAGFGRVAPEHFLKGHRPVAPSALPYLNDPEVMTVELSTDEIENLVKEFEFAAKVLKLAGIDAAELHAHEGYLFDQFQAEIWNKRTDKYGGNFENRLRFTIEVVDAIKKGAGKDFPIIYRFGLKHYLEGAREIDEGLKIARRMESAGVDALEVDAGCYETWYWAHPTTYQPPGLMVDMAELAKKAVDIPIIAIGKLGYPDLAERVLQTGKADFIALGRPLLADPEWPNKVRQGRVEDIRPCIGDNEGCLARLFESKHTSCTVNPTVGIERELTLKKARERKSILVVGGGPGGMEAARVAALRGHDVTLLEKKDVLGGNLLPAAVPDFKSDYRDLIKYLSIQIKKLGVTIELQRQATRDLIEEMAPDVVIVATGAEPIIPDILDIGRADFATAADVLLDKTEVGHSVTVVGGGLIGCETALYLAQQGKNVTIIEALPDLARNTFKANRMFLLEMLSAAKVRTSVETKLVDRHQSGEILVEKDNELQALRSDSLVIAMGYKPRRDLVEVLKGSKSDLYAIGDCVEARNVKSAIWEGYRTARLI